MIKSERAYHALTGIELRQAIVNEVTRALDKAGIDSVAITYPGVTWSWSLSLFQKDAEGKPLGEQPELHLDAGISPQEKSSLGKLIKALGGGSSRFKNDPPAPSEVREEEGLARPEA